MDGSRDYLLTGLTILLGLFLLFLGFFILVDDEPDSGRALGVLVTVVPAVALFAGLWYLRSGRLPTSVCLGAVTLGVVGGLIWFWMVIPPIVALGVLWFGVVKGGLARELRTA